MRPAREDETPVFGSIWQYVGTRFMAIGVRPRATDSRFAMLVSIRFGLLGRNTLDKVMTWGYWKDDGSLRAVTSWEFVEGPEQ